MLEPFHTGRIFTGLNGCADGVGELADPQIAIFWTFGLADEFFEHIGPFFLVTSFIGFAGGLAELGFNGFQLLHQFAGQFHRGIGWCGAIISFVGNQTASGIEEDPLFVENSTFDDGTGSVDNTPRIADLNQGPNEQLVATSG